MKAHSHFVKTYSHVVGPWEALGGIVLDPHGFRGAWEAMHTPLGVLGVPYPGPLVSPQETKGPLRRP